MKFIIFCSISIMLAFSSHSQQILTVGTDANCDRELLFDAIGSNRIIRVTNQTQYSLADFISSSFEIHGGYDNCTDAANNIKSNTKTTITGLNSRSAISIRSIGGSLNVVLSDLELINGKKLNNTVAGGLSVSGDVVVAATDLIIRDNADSGIGIENGAQLTLKRSEIESNSASSVGGAGIKVLQNAVLNLETTNVHHNSSNNNGGGILLTSSSEVNIIESEVNNNLTTNSGGGIFCSVGARLAMDENSLIQNNQAKLGGGISLNGCEALIRSGDTESTQIGRFGINNNTATFTGGGLHVFNSALTLKGSEQHFVNILNNQTTDPAQGFAGGIFGRGANTHITIINGRISGNQAIEGSAIGITERAHLTMRRIPGSCFGNQLCSEISDNQGTNSTITVNRCASANVFQTVIKDNTNNLNLVSINGNNNDACHSIFEGNVVFGNQNSQAAPTTANLFQLDQQVTFDFAFNTVTDNQTNHVFNLGNTNASNQTLNINSSIIWNSPSTIITANATTTSYSGQCFLVPSPNTLPAEFGPLIIADDPAFVDAAANNYQLSFESVPIDHCDTSTYQPRHHDAVGFPRGRMVVGPVLGNFDMGAFEYSQGESTDVIFYDVF